MRKVIISNKLVIVLLIVLLYSCKKKDPPVALPDVATEKIDEWIEKQKRPGKTFRNRKIQELRDNLDLRNPESQTLNSKDRVIIIPIKEGYKPGTSNDAGSVHCFLAFLDPEGKIIRGNVVQTSGEGAQTFATSASLINDHFNSRLIKRKARIALLDAAGWLKYETSYDHGKIISIGRVKSKPVSGAEARITCYQYTLTTTFYYSDGSTEVFEQDLGIVCEGSDMVQIPMPEESSGDPNPNGNCCLPDPNVQLSSTAESQTLSQDCTEYSINGKQYKTCFYSWVFSTNRLLAYTWRFINYLRADLEKENGVWKFVSITSSGNTIDGQLPPCVASNVTVNWMTNTISPSRTTADTRVNYTVSFQVTCVSWGSPGYTTKSAMAHWVA